MGLFDSVQSSETGPFAGATPLRPPAQPDAKVATDPAEASQDCLNALPIAAAVLCDRRGEVRVLNASPPFAALALGSIGGTIADPTIRIAALRFLAAGDKIDEFVWNDVEQLGGRHFAVRFARLPRRRGLPPRCLLSLIDRTAQIDSERCLRTEATHDRLTGLPNRAAFSEALQAAINSPDSDGRFAVLVIDLTRFSRVNESMGSPAGDELIITVARRLLGALRAGDMLARVGGDEFAILIHLDDGPGDALHIARRVQQLMASPFRLSDLEILVDSAMGCALVTDRIGGSEDLLRNAQFALKRSKASGRLEVYQPGEIRAARLRFSLETELRRAIEQQQLRLAFQPLIDLRSGRVAGFEALARWAHPERGEIMPAEFIPVAEETGLVVPLGRWALDAATQTLAGWDRRQGRALPISVSVNLSAIQISRDDVPAVVAGALARSGIPGNRLTIELTESAIIADPDRAGPVMMALKDLRTRIAMDDFGTGYSSLASLQRLPIDQLKIDRSFVTDMTGDRDALAIVRAVLGLAQALGMEITAEGIETDEVAQMLAGLGCTYGQGYHFARPLEADAAFAYWLARSA